MDEARIFLNKKPSLEGYIALQEHLGDVREELPPNYWPVAVAVEVDVDVAVDVEVAVDVGEALAEPESLIKEKPAPNRRPVLTIAPPPNPPAAAWVASVTDPVTAGSGETVLLVGFWLVEESGVVDTFWIVPSQFVGEPETVP